jgi:hypothetical protein
MISKLKNIFSSKQQNFEISHYLNQPEHLWISEDKYVKSSIEEFLMYVPDRIKIEFFQNKKVIFAKSNAMYSCTFENKNQAVIIIFPDLLKILKSFDSRIGQAILAHELGHIVCNHSKANINVMEAQVEADRFACQIGYLKEIEEFLIKLPESYEKRIRLTYITQFAFTSGIQH